MTARVIKTQMKRAAGLSRIYLSESDTNHYMKQLEPVLEWMHSLEQVDTTGVHPMRHGVHTIPDSVQELTINHDKVKGDNISGEIKNHLHSEFGYFVVPKAIDDNS